MPESTKQFPLSDYKRANLRSEGVFPRSEFTHSLLRTAFVLGVVVVGGEWFVTRWASEWKLMFDATRHADSLSHVFSMLWFSVLPGVLIFCAVALGALLLTALRSRFLIAPRFAVPSLSRLFQFTTLLNAIGPRFFNYVLYTVVFLLWLTLVAFVGMALYEQIISQPAAYPFIFELRGSARVLLFVLLVAVSLSALVDWLLYQQAHKMTRAEIEEEARETEGSPEVRRLMRELVD